MKSNIKVFTILIFFAIAFVCCSTEKGSIANRKGVSGSKVMAHANHTGNNERCSLCKRGAYNQEDVSTASNPIKDQNPITASINKEELILVQERGIGIPPNQKLAETEKTVEPTTNLKNNKKFLPGNKQVSIEGIAVISFIIGILGFLFSAFLVGFIFSLIAIIFGMLSLDRFKENPEKYLGKGFAIAGMILGLLGVIFFIAFLSYG